MAEFAHGVGADPQGVGAFEFQVKYDNHVFDITISPTGWLYSTGRIPDDGSLVPVAASATIISENDIRFGCVSKNPQPVDAVNGSCLQTIRLPCSERCAARPQTAGSRRST